MKKTIAVLFHALMLTYRPREVRKIQYGSTKKSPVSIIPASLVAFGTQVGWWGEKSARGGSRHHSVPLLAQYLPSEHSPRFVELAVYNSSVTRAR